MVMGVLYRVLLLSVLGYLATVSTVLGLECRQYGGVFAQPHHPTEAITSCKAEKYCLRLELSNVFFREVRYNCDWLSISNTQKLVCDQVACREYNARQLKAAFNWEEIPKGQRKVSLFRLCCCNGTRCEPDPFVEQAQRSLLLRSVTKHSDRDRPCASATTLHLPNALLTLVVLTVALHSHSNTQ